MLIPSDALCNNVNGCSESCGIEFINNKVYGCDGVWYNDGLDNAEYLCNRGYHICTSYTEAETLGLTKNECTSNTIIQPNHFYISRQSSSGGLLCDNTGTNDLFGCASSTDTGWIYFGDDNNPINCGPFSATLSTESAGTQEAWRYGWEPWGGVDDHENEIKYIEHRHNQREIGTDNWEFTNETYGGVLCCSNTNIQTTLYTTTETILECDGCSDEASCDVEFVADAIYGCGGIWNKGGIENGEYLCNNGYEICPDGDIASTMGLTHDICKNKPKANHFYASSAHSYPDNNDINDNDKCTNYNLENSSKPLGYDDVFGCGFSNEGWIHTTYVNCGSFSSKIEWGVLDEAKYGWELRDIDQQNELKAIRHTYKRNTNDIYGGVLCCKKPNKTDGLLWEAWHIEKQDTHSCKISTGCTQTIGLITCDIEFIPNRIYGCGGKFENRGIQNGEWICRNGYSICSTDTIVEQYGLTKEMCASYPKQNHFYASYSSTDNSIFCHDTLSAETSVFGCGLDVQSNWLWTISQWTENNIPVSCGPYTAALTEFNYMNGQQYGWNVTAGGRGKEKYYTKHLSWDYGGVMCCRDLGESTYEAEYHKNLLSFWSARISEIISLFVTIIIIIISYYGSKKKRKSGRSPRRGNTRYKCFNIAMVELVPIFAYLVYFIGVIELLWSIITIWLMTNNYDEIGENIDCAIILQVRNVFHIFYKIALYLFLIYKIEGVLHGSAYAYHKLIYLFLKIFSIGGVIITYSLLFISDFVYYQQFPGVINGFDCYLSVNSWLLYLQGTVDGIASIVCCFMFIYKLYFVFKQNDSDTVNPSRFRSIIFRNTLLSLIALLSTWIFYYIGFQGRNALGWFYSLDFLINNLCIWLMFKHNQLVFRKLCCFCFIYCGCQCAEKNTQIFGSRTSKETSKTSKINKTAKKKDKDKDTWHTPIHQAEITGTQEIKLTSLDSIQLSDVQQDVNNVVTSQASADINTETNNTNDDNIEKNLYHVTNK